jgi:hypothetical protein
MVSLIGLITLFLRLTLAIQSQMVEVVPSEPSNKNECIALTSPVGHITSSEGSFTNNISLIRKLETEEKQEVEGDNLLLIVDYFNLRFFENASRVGLNSFFGNKALRGSLPPLYDLFHSWKIHLS